MIFGERLRDKLAQNHVNAGKIIMKTRAWIAIAVAVCFAGSAVAQPVAKPRTFDTHGTDANGNWLVDSSTLDADEAQAEGEIQSGLGNCRLMATGGDEPALIDGGPEKADHGLIIVADADDSGSAAAETAADTAWAYGEIYNEAVSNTCGF